MVKKHPNLLGYYHAFARKLDVLPFPFNFILGIVVGQAAIYLLTGRPPHPAVYGFIVGPVIVGTIAIFVSKLPDIDNQSKATIIQISALNGLICLMGSFFHKQNNWGGINVFGRNLSGVRGSYDYLPSLSTIERANFADIAISNFVVSVVGALAVSLCVYLLNRYLVTHYKIAGTKSFPQLMAALVLLVLVSFSAYGSYQFYERHKPYVPTSAKSRIMR